MDLTKMTDQEVDRLSVELTSARVEARAKNDTKALETIKMQALAVQAELSRRLLAKKADPSGHQVIRNVRVEK
jgi:hypothetical protein